MLVTHTQTPLTSADEIHFLVQNREHLHDSFIYVRYLEFILTLVSEGLDKVCFELNGIRPLRWMILLDSLRSDQRASNDDLNLSALTNSGRKWTVT